MSDYQPSRREFLHRMIQEPGHTTREAASLLRSPAIRTTNSEAGTPPSPGRLRQFSLRTLFWAMTLAALLAAGLTGALGVNVQAVIWGILMVFWGILMLAAFVAVHLVAAAAFVLPVAFALRGIRYLGGKLLGCVRGVTHANDPH